MAVTKVLARDWKIGVKTGEDATTSEPIFTEVKGLNTLTFASSKSDSESTTFDTNGWNEHIVASRGRSLSLAGYYLVDPATGTRDAGQNAVDTLGEQIGPSSLELFELTSPAGAKTRFYASSNPAERGGGVEGNTSWGAELTVSGQVTKI